MKKIIRFGKYGCVRLVGKLWEYNPKISGCAFEMCGEQLNKECRSRKKVKKIIRKIGGSK